MWTAEVYSLAILIAIFSGIWIYIKLLLMFICFVMPPRWYNSRARGRTLEGKNSFSEQKYFGL